MSCAENYCPSCRETTRAFYVDLLNQYEGKKERYYQCGKCGVIHAGMQETVIRTNRMDLMKCPYCHTPVEDHGCNVVCRNEQCPESDQPRNKVYVAGASINRT